MGHTAPDIDWRGQIRPLGHRGGIGIGIGINGKSGSGSLSINLRKGLFSSPLLDMQ